MPDTDLAQAIADAAAAPKRATGDNGSTEQHGLPDLIAADRYLAGKNATMGRGFRLTKICPGGTA